MIKHLTATPRIVLMAVPLVAIIALAFLMVAGQSAAKPHPKPVKHDSSVSFEGTDDQAIPGTTIVYGNVSSDTKRCLKGRTIQVFPQRFEKATKPEDVARSSDNGYFAAAVASEGYGASTFKLLPLHYGSKKHPQACTGDKLLPFKHG